MWLLKIVGSKLGRLVAGVSAVLGMILLVFAKGKQSERQKQRLKSAEDELEARRAVDEVDTDLERDARIERMRKAGNVRED